MTHSDSINESCCMVHFPVSVAYPISFSNYIFRKNRLFRVPTSDGSFIKACYNCYDFMRAFVGVRVDVASTKSDYLSQLWAHKPINLRFSHFQEFQGCQLNFFIENFLAIS